jgi:hypothetical protein
MSFLTLCKRNEVSLVRQLSHLRLHPRLAFSAWTPRQVLSLLAALIVSISPTPATAQTVSVPAGLSNHFGFGIEAGQGDTWMPESGIAWDYRWQYLAGGVNTNQGWETWNPNGTFALYYAMEADQRGFIPMFPYYELFQSSGNCNSCNENQKTLTNLNTPATMRAYFDNFALLMKRLGPGTYDGIKGFSKTALVNVEPDFSGGYTVQAVNNGVCFSFCTGRGNDPALLRASVATSGHPDVAAYPDTYVGATQALAHLRDLYAPNVLLGYEVSPWATGVDIGMDSNPNLNAAAMGQQVGVFLRKTGPHEVLFSDPLDRDAGQYKAQFGQNRWWDRLNVRFPNFARWEQYLNGSITADNNTPMLLWQVPVGNQYFQTENNTDGHYQDNRAEYIFGHIPELIQTGVIGALFGPGNGGNSAYGDNKHDGVTNPPAFCTTDGISTGQICNDHPSSVADDDGGYIRMMGKAYYQNTVALAGAPASPPATAPAPAPALAPENVPLRVELGQAIVDPGTASMGQDVTFRQDVRVTTDATLLIDFELWDSQGQKVWQIWHDNQSLHPGGVQTDTAVLTIPESLPAGQYTFVAGVFSAGWGIEYAWNSTAGVLTIGE